jgi:hypothetical protein
MEAVATLQRMAGSGTERRYDVAPLRVKATAPMLLGSWTFQIDAAFTMRASSVTTSIQESLLVASESPRIQRQTSLTRHCHQHEAAPNIPGQSTKNSRTGHAQKAVMAVHVDW